MRQFLYQVTTGLLTCGVLLPVNAQVISDFTTNTIVNQSGNDFTIINGIEKGNNLFHSFSNFSVTTGGSAKFDLTNTPNITTIFSRVTGSNVSQIDGLIKTVNSNNAVSLFLMNPNGIVFGKNAALNIGGSFVGTTANSIKFADGVEFSAVNASSPPLLTMRVPVGLQMGQNPGSITVQGNQNQLTDSTGFGTANASKSPPGLQVGENHTLALIGSGINFYGGVASTKSSGHLEIGSVSTGLVGLNATPTGWVPDYSTVLKLDDVHLAEESLLNATGYNGSIQIQGQNISLTEGSAVLLQNLGIQESGGITVKATGSLNLMGNTANGELGSLIQINNFATGKVGDISISAAQLSLQDGARIVTRTRTQTNAGNIITNVGSTTDIRGFNIANPALYTGIVTFSLNSGNAGNITVSTDNLRILDSGAISSVAVSSGETGKIQVNAANLIEIAGYNPLAFSESSLSTFTQGSGNANSTIINTSKLVIQGGASLGSSTLATGSAGSVEIKASESIYVEGRATQGNAAGTVSRVFSNAEILSPAIQAAFELPAIPTGNSGSLTINTPLLSLIDGGVVSVTNDGPGKGGDVRINANSIFLDHQGSISASTASGNGGDVRLDLQDYLLMRHNSAISATAVGNGNGGNLSISSPIIVGLENSDIIANAVQGHGGNINIKTQGIFGLQYRLQLTIENDITASSQFGVNGTVDINNFGVDPNSGLVQLPANITDPSQQIASGCSANTGSSFVATGRGGIPQNPMQEVGSDRTWSDIRDISAFQQNGAITAQIPQSREVIVQATSWHRNAQGKIELVASQSSIEKQQPLTCAAIPLSKL
ncbi:S-layer family protein [Calothrix sp. FACHB-1219]|uniref:two-partner secretion domain-containing protein n=1 Tax=unclassified Calothrix TaxID=2619626 RepID=UPI001685B403|nr:MULTISPECIES: S-layer family protein [unclassified Calothrix]MBD2202485.1 S-layer family protein [Calothrix sp. FACHB-168]MBD2217924.1 S-layer family protein [Calothrix sp. FACHB-1219]